MSKLTSSFGRDYESFVDDLELLELNGESIATDVYEENGNVIVEAHISGLDPEHIDISVEGNELFIEGFREEIFEEEDRDYFMQEISYGAFERVVPLPSEVNLDQAEAEYDNGVLSIILPKTDSKPRKKIDVKSDSKSKAKKATAAQSRATSKSASSNSKKASNKTASSNNKSKSASKSDSSNNLKLSKSDKSNKSNGRKSAQRSSK